MVHAVAWLRSWTMTGWQARILAADLSDYAFGPGTSSWMRGPAIHQRHLRGRPAADVIMEANATPR
jgi:hypothetical protein